MAKLIATTHRELTKALDGRDSRTIGNNTTAVRREDPNGGPPRFEIYLHGHHIATVHAGGVDLGHRGYITATTADRLRQLARPLGWNVYRSGGAMYAAKGEAERHIERAPVVTIA